MALFKGVQFGSQNFLKIWDLTNSGEKMTMEILFFIFEVKFGQAAPSKSAKRKSHLLPIGSKIFFLQNNPQIIILNLTEFFLSSKIK
jgi:hypothetical protein